MKLNGLVSLYRDMKHKNIDRYRFEYKHGKALFDVFFFIDENPFILLFGTKGDSFSFEVKVESGFEISPQLDRDTYRELCRVLGLEFDSNNPFSPKSFFESFDGKIPQNATASNAHPHDIAKYRNVAEEEDKVYFRSWRNNEIRSEHVSEANLQKTKDLLGVKAYERCQSKNISSCWTDDSSKAKEVSLPE